MHRMPATIEEQLILKAIKEECSWENLPKRLQSTLASKDEWHRRCVYFVSCNFTVLTSEYCLSVFIIRTIFIAVSWSFAVGD